MDNLLRRDPYETWLSPEEEEQYRAWVLQNSLLERGIDPKSYNGQDYDMRGFYRGLQQKDPRAISGINPVDNELHFPDVWKKPSHAGFSNQSIYSGGNNAKYAGSWEGEVYTPSAQRFGMSLLDELARRNQGSSII